MLAGSVTIATSFMRPWHLGQASTSTANVRIWVDFMKGALAGIKSSPFTVPSSNIIFVEIDRETGLLATPACPTVCSEAFIAGTEPHEYCGMHGFGHREGATALDPPHPRG